MTAGDWLVVAIVAGVVAVLMVTAAFGACDVFDDDEGGGA